MLIYKTELTPALKTRLEESHDDEQLPLLVEQSGDDITVHRADGSPLSATEALEIEALLAAHAVEPLKQPPGPNHRFVRFAGSAHINNINIALYEQDTDHFLAIVESVVSGKRLGMQSVRKEDFDAPLGANELAREVERISYGRINLFGDESEVAS